MHTFVLQEYCDLGTLRDYVVLRLGLPPRLKAGEPEAMARLLQLLHDSATGLAALHDAKVVHGDLVSGGGILSTGGVQPSRLSAFHAVQLSWLLSENDV
jgi:serine/threonine protein kinase